MELQPSDYIIQQFFGVVKRFLKISPGIYTLP